jgi:hypothetical protein
VTGVLSGSQTGVSFGGLAFTAKKVCGYILGLADAYKLVYHWLQPEAAFAAHNDVESSVIA